MKRTLEIFVFLFLSLLQTQAIAASHSHYPSCAQITASTFLLPLPQLSSPEFSTLVSSLRHQLLSNSYALIDLRAFLPAHVGENWFLSIPHEQPSQILGGEIFYEKNGALVSQNAHPDQVLAIQQIQLWLRELIRQATQNNLIVKDGVAGVRFATKNSKGVVFDKWHVDGGGAVVTLAMHGPGTEILGLAPFLKTPRDYHEIVGTDWERLCPECVPQIIPTGYALIFLGGNAASQNIGKALIHRTPLTYSDRVVTVIRY